MPLLRRRRPLLRAAAVGGGAYLAGKHHAEREQYQDPQYAPQPPQPQYAPPQAAPVPQQAAPAGGISDEMMGRLRQLGELHEQGVLTDEEFAAQKSKLLA
jgi:hypothetical protein